MERIFEIFEEIMRIPRSSGDEEKIADYIVDFANKNNLENSRDNFNNVFIMKNNNSDKTIILQAHSDMVCVSNTEYDFENQGIAYYIDGDYYKAKNTSLGADDGIGIAIILAMLEETDNMPNIEVMITTSEETTMEGANNYDYKLLTGKTLISLDGIKEGDIEVSSAGMCSLTINKHLNFEKTNGKTYKLIISGLAGGHSGDDIHKKRCNAIKLIFKLIKELGIINLNDINIGEKDNVIPNSGDCIFTTDLDLDVLKEKIDNINLELSTDDNDLKIELVSESSELQFNKGKDIIDFINDLEDGLLEEFKEDKFPLLSSNIGKISIDNGSLVIKMSIRSSNFEKLERQLNKVKLLASKYSLNLSVDANKPFFPFKKNSVIRNLLCDTYSELYNKSAVIKKVHACMEGGIISSKIDDLDICVIAPTISDCHTINERVSISSTTRMYNWLRLTLQKYNNI